MESVKSKRFVNIVKPLMFSSFLTLSSFNGACQDDIVRISDDLNKYVQPIGSREKDFDYSSIIGHIQNKKIIGLGESSHGTKEIYNAKKEVIMRLIQTGEVKTVFIESEHAGMEPLNAWLKNSNDEGIEDIMRQSSFYGIYRTKEVLTMLHQIKAYNQSQDLSERVSLYGIDMQHTPFITNAIMDLLLPEAVLAPKDKVHLKYLDSIFKAARVHRVQLSKTEIKRSEELIKEIRAISENQNKKMLSFYANLLNQSLQIRSISPSSHKLSELRDKFMADNIIWLNENLGDRGKAVIWGHNSHIGKRDSRPPKRMGFYLHKYYGNQYYALGFAFNQGNVNFFGKSVSYEPVENKKAIEFVFKHCEPEDFFIQIDDLHKDAELLKALSQFKYMRVIGATRSKKQFYYSPFWETFDGIIFFNKTRPAEVL